MGHRVHAEITYHYSYEVNEDEETYDPDINKTLENEMVFAEDDPLNFINIFYPDGYFTVEIRKG